MADEIPDGDAPAPVVERSTNEPVSVEVKQAEEVEQPIVIEPPKVTTAAEWRRRARAKYHLALASGAIIVTRRPDWGELIAHSVVTADEMMTVRIDTPEGYAAAVGFAKRILPHCVVEPVVVAPNGELVALSDEVISTEDISKTDLVMVLMWALGRNNLGSEIISQ